MSFAIDYNDLSIGANDIPGERADTLNRTINELFCETIEDWDFLDTLRELEEETE